MEERSITVDPPYDWACFATPAPPSIDVWHQRLAHTSVKKIRKMASLEMVDGLILPNHDVSINQPCPGCMFGKMQRSKFKLGRTKATQIRQLIHSDVCGPMHVASPRGSKYFVLFTDDFSGYRTVYFLKQKSVKKINSKSPTPLKNSSILCVQRPDNQFTH